MELTAYHDKLPTVTTRREDAGTGIMNVKVDAALPRSWTERTDTGTGRLYYTNEVTEETSWMLPTAGALL